MKRLFRLGIGLCAVLITLVYSLLSGDTTLRFMLKVVVVGAITGVMFGYFLRAVRADGAGSGP